MGKNVLILSSLYFDGTVFRRIQYTDSVIPAPNN